MQFWSKHAYFKSGMDEWERFKMSRESSKEWLQNASSENFLVFSSHSGFSNQLLGLSRAAILAYVSNRTLVIPPILGHFAVSYGSRVRCSESRNAVVMEKSLIAYRRKKAILGSFVSIYSFQLDKSFEKVRIIDWKEFVNRSDLNQASAWFKDPYPYGCGNESANISVVISHLKSLNQHRVVQIGSAFMFRLPFESKNASQTTHGKVFENLQHAILLGNIREPISNFSRAILQRMQTGSSKNFMAVHLRAGDKKEFIASAFKELTTWIRKLQNPRNIYVASDLPQKDFYRYAQNISSADAPVEFFMLEQLLSSDSTLSAQLLYLSETIGVDPSVLKIVLDQHICALSASLLTISGRFSTFAKLTRLRHDHYNSVH